MSESLAAVYLPIIPDASKIAPGVKSALGHVEKDAGKSGKSLGTRLGGAMSVALKASAAATGAAVGGVLGAAMTKGMGRLVAIDTAEAKLTGLGHSADNVAGIMDNALASVKGTAFGLGEAGSAAASAVAAGIRPGKDLERTLKLMGDAAAIAGTDLNSMASIFNKVATDGRIQNDVIAQLGDRGIPILQLLADQLGVTAEEARKMASQGQVDFATFQNAIEEGMGGAALALGDTFAGAVDNAGAALGRLGAAAIGPFFDDMGDGVRGFTAIIDTMTDRVGPASQALRDRLGPAAQAAGDWIASTALPAVEKLGAQAASAGPTLQALGQSILGMADPALRIGSALSTAAASLGVSSWQLFLTTLDATAAILNTTVAPVLSTVADLAESNEWAVTGLVAAWTAFKTVPGILDKVKGSMGGLTTAASGIRDMQAYAKATGSEMTRMEAAVAYAGTSSNTVLSAAGRAATQAGGGFRSLGAAGVAAAKGGLKSLGAGLTNVINAMGGPLVVGIGAAVALIGAEKAAAAEAARANEKLSEAVRDGEAAQLDFARSLAETSGAMSEQGLAAAARVAAGELAAFTTEGERSIGPVERMAHAMSGVDAVLERIPGMYTESGKAINAQNREVKAAREAYSALEDAMQDLQLPMSELPEIVAAGGAEYERLRSHLQGLGDEGTAAAAQLDDARAAIERIEAQARVVEPGFYAAAQAVEELGNAADGSGDKLSALQRMLQALGLAPRDAEAAMFDAARATEDLTERAIAAIDPAHGLGSAMFDAAGALIPTHDNAQALESALTGLHDELLNVAANGGDVQAAFDNMSPSLEALREQFQLTPDEMQRMIEHFGLIPDNIETVVGLTGQDEVAQNLLAVAAGLNDVEEGATARVTVDSDEAYETLDALGWEISEELPDGTVEITARDEEARMALINTAAEMDRLDATEANPTVRLSDAEVGPTYDRVMGRLQEIDDRDAVPEVMLDRSGFIAGTELTMEDIELLASQTPTPVADIDAFLLQQGVRLSEEQLEALHRKKTEPVLDADGQPLQDGVDRAKRKLLEVRDRTVTLRVNTEYTSSHAYAANSAGARTNVTRTGSTVGNMYSGGGTIPGLATGGRVLDLTDGGALPTSGPGTHVTDGFLGIDDSGMPLVRVDAGEEVINRRASDKHRDLLKAINRDDPRIADLDLPALNTGGTVRNRDGLDRALAEAQSSHDIGARYLWGGASREASDCSGFVGRVAWAAQGVNPDTAGRMGNTTTMLANQWPGFRRGRFGPFVVGVNDVHMAATIDGIPVESGGDVGGPSVGEGDGADDRQFSTWYSMDHDAFAPPFADVPPRLPDGFDPYDLGAGEEYTGSRPAQGDGGDDRHVPLSPEASRAAEKASQDKHHPLYGTGADSISELGGNLVGGVVQGHLASLLRVLDIPDQLPPIVKAGRLWYQQVADDASPREVKEQDEAVTEAAQAEAGEAEALLTEAEEPAPAPAPVDDGTPQSAGRRAVAPRGWDKGAQWDALDYIYQRESEWNPLATNPSSGAFGIPQFNPVSGTLQQYLPDRSTDPFTQVTAGAQYIEDRYGDPVSARRFWEANRWYDRGGVARGVGHMLKNTLEPERVLSPEQTRAFEELVFNQLDDLAGLAESVVSSGVSGAVGAGAGMADMVMPGAGAMLSPLGGPAGDIAGWYAGEVAGNLVDTGATFVRDIGDILGSQLQAMSPVDLPPVQRAAPIPAHIDTAPGVGRVGDVEGGVHFHVADMHEAITRARRISADEARGMIGV